MSETSTLTVMVIDDEETHADIVSRVIAKAGHRVDAARNVEEALVEIESRDYDLVITDIFMAGMGGLAGIEKIRQLQPAVMIIAMSAGYADMSAAEALEKAREIGADAVLPKPFPLADLFITVSSLLEDRPRE